MSTSLNQVIGRPRTAELKPPLFVDIILLVVTLALVSFSLVMIYSTTAILAQERFGDSLYYLRRQGLSAVLGIIVMVIASRLPLIKIRKLSVFLYPLALALIALTLLPGVGDSAGGAHRWINLGPLRMQPVELVKLGFIVFMAGYFSRHESTLDTFGYGVMRPVLLVGALAGLLLLQPDFGSASVLIFVTLSMATASGAPLRHLVLCGVGLACCLALLIVISPYRMNRVVGFLSPFSDASGKGYQLIQSLIAVGSGQVAGVGLGAGQQKLFYLPAAHTDFIFAVIAEELGFIGCLALIGLFLLFLWRGLRLAFHFSHDTFLFALTIGLTSLIVVPAFLNMGVVIGLLPTKGLVLPLIGYGGSSLVANLATVGLLLGLARALYLKKG